MDQREIPLPLHWWACDQTWNQAVATGRGSVSTGALYFETVSRGPILVQSDDVDRLLASLQNGDNGAAPAPDAAAESRPTSPTVACSPGGCAMDPFEATHWNQAQVVLWICSRDRAAVRQTSHTSDLSGDIGEVILRGVGEAAGRDVDFFIMSFESAEEEAINKLFGGKLCAFGRKNGNGVREAILLKNGLVLSFSTLE